MITFLGNRKLKEPVAILSTPLRNAKENSSGWQRKQPDGNSDLQERIKNTGNGK